MQNEYAARDAVVVFDGSYWASQARHGLPAPVCRAGVIVADRTPLELVYDPRGNHGQGAYVDGAPILPRIYEVRYADGTSAHVSVEHMASRDTLATAQAAADQQAVAATQAHSDDAKQLAEEAAALKRAHAKQQTARSSS
jgi:hypothetical protein